MRKFTGLALAAMAVPLAVSTAVTAQEVAEPTVAIGAAYTGDFWHNARGGLRKGERYLDDLGLTVEVDAEQAFGLSGGTFFFYGLMNNGATLSDTLVGDAQTVSNIDTPYAIHLYEAWYQQQFAQDRASLKIGLYDVNSEFDAIDVASLFINSSHGIGPDFSQSGLTGPSVFPITSLGARLQANISENVTVRAAVLDAVPGDPSRPKRTAIKLNDGALLLGEIEVTHGETTAALGVWRYTSKFEDLEKTNPTTGAPAQRGGNMGGYAEIETKLTSDNEDGGLFAFARAGIANSNINQFGSYLGGGLRYTGLLTDEDSAGFAVAHARNGNTFERVQRASGTPVNKAETNLEFTYHVPLTSWLAVQPDVQYVINPGTDPGLRNALVIGLRFEIGFDQSF